MANQQYKFGDYDLEDVAEQLSWDYNIDAPSYPLGREDGSRHGGATLVNKQIRLEGYLFADTYAEWRSRKDELMRSLFPTPRVQKLTLSDDRSYMAEVVSLSVPEWIGLPQTPISITFMCHDPFEYSETQQNNWWNNVVTTVWTGYDTSARSTFMIHNGGIVAYPRLILGLAAVTQPIVLECRWGNLLRNSNFLTDADDDGVADYWTATGSGTCNLDPTTSVFNKLSQEITNAVVQTTTVYQLVPSGPGLQGQSVTASCYISRDGSGNNVYARVEQYDSSGTLISGHDTTKLSTSTSFVRVSTTFTVDSNCYYLKYILVNEASCKANFDGAMLEIGSSMSGSWKQGTCRSLTLTESLTATDRYVIDCSDKTVTKNTTGSSITNKLGVMTGEFFSYEYGYNLLILTHAASAVSGMYLQSLFTPRYL